MGFLVNINFWLGIFIATLRMSVPLTFGSLGELFNERAGILNLGIEGIMSLSASSAFLTVKFSNNLWLGLLAGCLVGICVSIIFGILVISLRLNQHVCGIGLGFICTGLSYYIYRFFIGVQPVPPTINTFPNLEIPILKNIPFVGDIFFKQNLFVYLSIIIVIIANFVMFKTIIGLKIRTCGENPATADTAGINVTKVRFISMCIGGFLIGLSGAYLTLIQINMFIFGMVAGRGWISIALVTFGNWHPIKCFYGSLLFAFIEAFSLRLQQTSINIPYQLFLMLPYIFTIIILILISRKAKYPKALLRPYSREED